MIILGVIIYYTVYATQFVCEQKEHKIIDEMKKTPKHYIVLPCNILTDVSIWNNSVNYKVIATLVSLEVHLLMCLVKDVCSQEHSCSLSLLSSRQCFLYWKK